MKSKKLISVALLSLIALLLVTACDPETEPETNSNQPVITPTPVPYSFKSEVPLTYVFREGELPNEFVQLFPTTGAFSANSEGEVTLTIDGDFTDLPEILEINIWVPEDETNLFIGRCHWDDIGFRYGETREKIYVWSSEIRDEWGYFVEDTYVGSNCIFDENSPKSFEVEAHLPYCSYSDDVFLCSYENLYVHVDNDTILFSVEGTVLPGNYVALERLVEYFGGGELPEIVEPGTLYTVNLN